MRLLALGLVLLAGCGDDDLFTAGLDLDVCEANLPTACGGAARCNLDQDHYIAGMFPSSRQFIVRTTGEANLLFQLLLTDERQPGTELRLEVLEPSCTDTHAYDSAGQDLFRLTGSDGVIQIPLAVTRGGDHLTKLVSDAYCSYELKWQQLDAQQ